MRQNLLKSVCPNHHNSTPIRRRRVRIIASSVRNNMHNIKTLRTVTVNVMLETLKTISTEIAAY